jgi:protein-S-isoprenylcysteine O-methyltransferase Ste14
MLLGGNWSSSMTVKQDHQLIRQGPYSIVRHPIYSGLLLALLGTALALGELRGIVDLALALAGWHT